MPSSGVYSTERGPRPQSVSSAVVSSGESECAGVVTVLSSWLLSQMDTLLSLQGKCYKIHVVEENAIFVFMNGLLTSIFVQVTKRASEH